MRRRCERPNRRSTNCSRTQNSEPIDEAGRYRLRVRLGGGDPATKVLDVPDGGIPDYVGYTVRTVGDDIEISGEEV